jgi:uncharacterized protein (DUF58 family)
VGTAPLLAPELLRQLDRLTVASRRARPGRLQGERRSSRHGQSVEFADFRPYTPGDDVRQVDWNAYARLERYFLKLFVAEEDTTVHVLVDTSRSMAWGRPPKLDFARRVAAALGYVALANLEWLSVAPFASSVAPPAPPLRGRAAAPELFRRLAALEPEGGTSLAKALGRYTAAGRRPGPLILLSDLYDPEALAGLSRVLAARYDLAILHVLAPEELAPDLDGDFRLVDDETGAAVELSADGPALAAYAAALAEWQAGLAAWSAARGVPYVPVASDTAVEGFVTRVLRERGVVGGGNRR